MKSKYQIDFNSNAGYVLDFYMLINGQLNADMDLESSIENFNSSFSDFTSKTLEQLELFIRNEELPIVNSSFQDLEEEKELLRDLIPVLCLSKSPSLDNQLMKLGFDECILDLFIDKNHLDNAISEFIEKFNLPFETHLAFNICAYSIAMSKCALKIEEALGFVYVRKGGRKITSSKHLGEQMSRRYRENKTIEFDDLSESQNQFVNSSSGKYFFDRSNKIASFNKEGSYNIQNLAAPMFILAVKGTPKKISDRKIFLGLYEIFKILYRDKGLKMNEKEWLIEFESLDPKKTPIGDNYTDYRVKKVLSILGHSNTEKLIEYYLEQNKTPDENLSPDDIMNFLLNK